MSANGVGSAHVAAVGDAWRLPVTLIKGSARVDVDRLMASFRDELGPPRWEQYRQSLTRFLMGKLSRVELVRSLKENLGLTAAAIRNHNTLVLALLANATRDGQPGADLAGWKVGGGRGAQTSVDAANDKLHADILGLSARERRRIKSITKDAAAQAKNPLVPPPLPMLAATRHVMLPHVPHIPETAERKMGLGKTKVDSAATPSGAAAAGTGSGPAGTSGTSGSAAATGSSKPKEQSPAQNLLDPAFNLTAGRSSGPLTWTQDIVQGLDTPLIAETHELPDSTGLTTRMLGVALEHGLIDGIGAGATDMMLIGLEYYLRELIGQLVGMRHRKFNSQAPLTAADLDLLVASRPAEVGEQTLPLLRLRTHFLHDEPTVESTAQKRASPWDLEAAREKRLKQATEMRQAEKIETAEPEKEKAEAESEKMATPEVEAKDTGVDVSEKGDPEKTVTEKADAEKADAEKADAEKADAEKADAEKAAKLDGDKAEPETSDAPKAESDKQGTPQADTPKTSTPKAEESKPDAVKIEAAEKARKAAEKVEAGAVSMALREVDILEEHRKGLALVADLLG